MTIPRILAGHDIYGVDIDPVAIAKGKEALREAGHDPNRFAVLNDGRSPFPAGHFDLVYSEATVEHVRDLAAFASEAYRLTAPGGTGLHSFPGHRRWQESHLLMPAIQWVPRRLVRAAILGYTLMGVEPAKDFPGVQGKSRRQRAAVYYRWLLTEAFYRSRVDVDAEFIRAGFTVSHPRHVLLSALTVEYLIAERAVSDAGR